MENVWTGRTGVTRAPASRRQAAEIIVPSFV
jgi:hypothetical protein